MYGYFYKYIGNWGSDVTVYRFDFIRHGMVEKSIIKAPVTDAVLEVLPSCTSLVEKTTYDVAEDKHTCKITGWESA